MNLERVVFAILITALILVAHLTNPAFSEIFAEPTRFVTDLLAGIAQQLQQFEGDFYQFLIGAGVSAPLTFGLVALLKKFKPLARFDTQHLAFAVAFVLYVVMMFAQRSGQELAFDNIVQVAVLIVSMLTGTSAAQLGASAIHERFVDSALPLAYRKTTQNAQG